MHVNLPSHKPLDVADIGIMFFSKNRKLFICHPSRVCIYLVYLMLHLLLLLRYSNPLCTPYARRYMASASCMAADNSSRHNNKRSFPKLVLAPIQQPHLPH